MEHIEEQGQSMDIEQMLQMAKMLGTMLKPPENNELEIVPQYRPIPFDEELQTQDIKIIKSVIPYMNINQQKSIGVLVKLMEIKILLEKNEDEQIITAQSEDDSQLHRDILMSIQPYCSKDKQNMLNMILRMLEMKKILVQIQTLKEVL